MKIKKRRRREENPRKKDENKEEKKERRKTKKIRLKNTFGCYKGEETFHNKKAQMKVKYTIGGYKEKLLFLMLCNQEKENVSRLIRGEQMK